MLAMTFLLFVSLFVLPMLPVVLRFVLQRFVLIASDVLLVVVGGIVAGVAMWGVWRIYTASWQLRSDASPDSAAQRMQVYLALQGHLQAFLWMVGSIISVATLTFGFAIDAINKAWCTSPNIPREVAWAYGLYYTALLGLSYVPTYLRLGSVGQSIREAAVGRPPINPEELEDWLRKRDALTGLLQIGEGPLASLKSTLFVLGPLLTSLLGTALSGST